jgi:site-specific recombinase XerD
MTTKEAVRKVRDFIRLKHFARSTEENYCSYVEKFCKHSKTLPPTLPAEKRIESFLSTFASNDCAASTQNVAFNAVLFLYRNILGIDLKGIDSLRATRPVLVRNAPNPSDTRAILNFIAEHETSDISLVCDLLYGTGARLCEPLNLRVRDVDLAAGKIIYRHAKQHKDRVVGIPCSLAEKIQQQLEYSHSVWAREGKRWPTKLPGRLRFKYPHAEFSFQWFWIFPATGPCPDNRDDNRLVRWRRGEWLIQRAVRRACLALGKSVTPHELRHGYATDSLNRGANPRAVQMAMGHKSLETTMGYCHADALSVPSPLDILNA